MELGIAGKSAIVCAASKGLGKGSALALAREGVAITISARGADALAATAEDIRAETGVTVRSVVCDVTTVEGRAKLLAACPAPDILINNAGISMFAPIDSEDYGVAWSKSMAVLLTAHTLTIRAALPLLRKSAHARIVNIASTEGLGATKYGSPYTAAKTGVIGLTRSLAVELGPENITVNCICPGPINTGMTSAIADGDKIIFAKRRSALRRYGAPEEVAHGTLGLVLPASQYITGVTLPVDGGLTIRNA